MRSTSKTKADEEWLKALGKKIEKEILKKGYESTYDFWMKKAGDHISRSTLNYIVAGKNDPKITTLKTLATLLEIPLHRLLNL